MAAAAPVAPLTTPPPMPDSRAITTQQRPGPAELFRTLGTGSLAKEAAEKGMSISARLEQLDPSGGHRDGLDAFQRQLEVAGISVMSDMDWGIAADSWEDFCRDANTRALAYEWAVRTAKRVGGRNPNTRALYASTDQPVGGVVEPFVNAAQARVQQIAPAIRLADLVALTTPIQGDAYRAFYLTSSTTPQRFNRVAQGAEIPRSQLTGADHTIRLFKYGKGIDFTYELVRRARIDVIGLHIARAMIQTEIDRVAAVIDIMVNGDGNSNTAAQVSNLTSMDAGATVGTLTAKAWLTFKSQFVNPYVARYLLAQAAPVVQLELLNLGSANIPMSAINAAQGLGGLNLIQPQLGEGIAVGLTSDAPASKIVALDNRFGIEHVTEIGADITEMERFVARQTNSIFLSYTDGFATMDQSAVRILNLLA